MTIKQLNKYRFIKKEIERIQVRLEELSSSIKSATINGMPRSGKLSNPTEEVIIKKLKLEKKLNKSLSKLLDQEMEIEDFITNIEDPAIKVIVRMKFIDLYSWDRIAKEFHYESSSPRKKLERYLEINNGKKKGN